MLVLSLFPGIGLLDMAFEEEGFCVVRGPDLLWGGDVRRFHPPAGKFDGIIGGPPCQAFSRIRHVNPKCGQKHGNMIPEYERVVGEAQPLWFLMENVREAPEPNVPGYQVVSRLLRDDWVGGETMRLRRFSFGSNYFGAMSFRIQEQALHTTEPETAVTASGGNRSVTIKIGGSGKVKKNALSGYGWVTKRDFDKALRLSGLPNDFLSEAPFTAQAKYHVVGNGVPLPMGRAVARAVKAAMYPEVAHVA